MWSQYFEYREPKNNDNSQFSCLFVFEKEAFERDSLQRKAMELLIDKGYFTQRLEKLHPGDDCKKRNL